ncbi:MAG: MotA/TolQ/ExbB proton channel family protein [Pseudomonadota bacterium]|nr:MotA/TolQ/ExbB proton channel family protein [Pseudomonadota bacterium]
MRTLALLILLLPGIALAQQKSGMDDLLKQIRDSAQQTTRLNQEREARFLKEKNEQQALLQKAQADLAAAEAKAARVRSQFDAGQAEITAMKQTLVARIGDASAMYAGVKETASTFRVRAGDSLVTAQVPERLEFLDRLAQATELPALNDLEQLWVTLAEEIAEGGRVARFKAEIVNDDGVRSEQDVVRVGMFTAFADDRLLTLDGITGHLTLLDRQPGHEGLLSDFSETTQGTASVLVDPTRGELLRLYTLKPSLLERLNQGGLLGYVILLIGIVGAALAIYQLFFLMKTGRKVQAQLQNTRAPTADNPLGRVLAVLKDETSADPEVLELHLSEAVLRETPAIERFQNLIRMIVAAGPLLGLLGTVIGMIITFQAILEAGTGDPRVMAGGISHAMVATVLGLGIAIPLLFINSLLATRSRALIQILDEQSAGLLARRLEGARAG